MFGDSGHDVGEGETECSYQLKQDYLSIDRVWDIIVISIYLRGNNLGLIAGDLGHADLRSDSAPVTDRAWQMRGVWCLTNALVVYVGRPRGKCAIME